MRGIVLTISCDIEMALLYIMLYCIVDDPLPVIRNFKGMMMGGKIAATKRDLQKYFPEYYTQYESTFNDLSELNEFRAMMAHCKILWDKKDQDPTFFEIVDISKVNGEERFEAKKITFPEFDDKTNRLRKLVLKLAELANKIRRKFDEKYPSFFKSAISDIPPEDKNP